MISLSRLFTTGLREGKKKTDDEDDLSPEMKKQQENRRFNAGLLISVLFLSLLFYVFVFMLFSTPSHLSSGSGANSGSIKHEIGSLLDGLAPRHDWRNKQKQKQKQKGTKPPHPHHRDYEKNKAVMGEELVLVDAHPKLEGDAMQDAPKRSFRHHRGNHAQ